MSETKFDPTKPVQFREVKIALKNPHIVHVGNSRLLVGYDHLDRGYEEATWYLNGRLNADHYSQVDLINVPEQAKPLECWVNRYEAVGSMYAYNSEGTAREYQDNKREDRRVAVHMREVYVPKNPTYRVHSYLDKKGRISQMTEYCGDCDTLYWEVEEQTGIVISGPHKL